MPVPGIRPSLLFDPTFGNEQALIAGKLETSVTHLEWISGSDVRCSG
jgi:hypothetical protein